MIADLLQTLVGLVLGATIGWSAALRLGVRGWLTVVVPREWYDRLRCAVYAYESMPSREHRSALSDAMMLDCQETLE